MVHLSTNGVPVEVLTGDLPSKIIKYDVGPRPTCSVLVYWLYREVRVNSDGQSNENVKMRKKSTP
jgi:hypothetical protein